MDATYTQGEPEMNVKNIFEPGAGGAGLGAVGGAGIAAFLGSILARNGVLGGNANGDGCVTPAQLSAALAGVTDTQMNTAVLQELGKISGAIPAAEGQVQLALAGTQNALSNQIGQQSLAVATGFGNISQNIAQAQAAVIAVGESVKDTVNATSAQTQLGIANLATSGLQNAYAVTQAVTNEGEKTRALTTAGFERVLDRLTAQNEATLQRQVSDLTNALNEQRANNRAVGTEVNVTQTVAQNQAQAQMQNQVQQQAILLSNVVQMLAGLQNAVATNSNLIVGNTGAVATGPQTANPVNVRA